MGTAKAIPVALLQFYWLLQLKNNNLIFTISQ
jgi:hypothetical protein